MLILLLASPAFSSDAPLEPGQILLGQWPGADFGAAILSAGDVDLNTKPDLLVGAPMDSAEGTLRGRAVLYLAARDNSGFGEVAWTVSGPVDRGQYGAALAGGHDLDGDGFADVAVGCGGSCWVVDVYLGTKVGPGLEPDWSMDGGGGSFGHAMAMLGDTDGDGYAELAIGDRVGAEHGAVHVYPGGAEGPGAPLVLPGEADHPIGGTVAAAGDLDGDGLADLATGSGVEDPLVPSISVYLGAAGGLGDAPAAWLSRPSDALGMGVSLGGGGDVDGDGLDDLVAGADGIGDDPAVGYGHVLGWSGATGGLPAWQRTDSVPDTLLGRAVAIAGDVDGDGYADVLAGRPGWQEDQDLEGGAVLYVGGPAGPDAWPAWKAGGDQSAQDHGGAWIAFGQAVAAVGDVDGDDRADVAVSAINTGASTYEARLGEVRLFMGTSWTPPAPQDTGQDTGDPADTGGGGGQETGCGCASALPSPAAALLLPLALLLPWRRR